MIVREYISWVEVLNTPCAVAVPRKSLQLIIPMSTLDPMRIQLTRPLVFVDLETTGIDFTKDRIVQLCAMKVQADGTEEVKTTLINPGIPIPAEATAVHNIRDLDVQSAPYFRQLAKSLRVYLDGCDIAGFNSNRFDLPMLVEEFARCGIEFPDDSTRLVDVQTIFHRKEERTLSAAYRFYCNKSLEGAHDAEADVRATAEIFQCQLERYSDIGDSIDDIHEYCSRGTLVDYPRRLARDEQGKVVFNFGKHKGIPVLEKTDYAQWMLEADFPESTKMVLRRVLADIAAADPSRQPFTSKTLHKER